MFGLKFGKKLFLKNDENTKYLFSDYNLIMSIKNFTSQNNINIVITKMSTKAGTCLNGLVVIRSESESGITSLMLDSVVGSLWQSEPFLIKPSFI